MHTPGSGSEPQVRLVDDTERTRDCYVAIGPFCNYQFDAFDSWRLQSEIQVQGNQSFFSSRRFETRLKKNLWV